MYPDHETSKFDKITTVEGPSKCFGITRLAFLQLFPLFVAVPGING